MENVPYKLVRNPPRPDLSGMSSLRRSLYLIIFEHDTAITQAVLVHVLACRLRLLAVSS